MYPQIWLLIIETSTCDKWPVRWKLSKFQHGVVGSLRLPCNSSAVITAINQWAILFNDRSCSAICHLRRSSSRCYIQKRSAKLHSELPVKVASRNAVYLRILTRVARYLVSKTRIMATKKSIVQSGTIQCSVSASKLSTGNTQDQATIPSRTWSLSPHSVV